MSDVEGTRGIIEGVVPMDSAQKQNEAVTNAAVAFDFSDRDLVELTGSDRVKFLHSFCTNDIKQLSAGQGCEAFLTNVKGKIVSHIWVDADESALWLDAVAGSAERLVPHLERYLINEDVTIADRSAEWGELCVVGLTAADRLEGLGIDVAALSPLGHRRFEAGGLSGRARRFDVGSLPGFVMVVRREQVDALSDRLREAGVPLADNAAWTALRIEVGLPDYGVDISEDNLAQEAGRTQSAISFTKGCYLGQEPIARIDAMGHVNRELRSLRLVGNAVPPPGAPVFADESGLQAVGAVTSAAVSYGTGSVVAMGLLRSSVSAVGSRVFVELDSQRVPAMVFWTPGVLRP